MIKHLEITVYGMVQGVGFRYSAQAEAVLLEVVGFARNEPNGTVFVEAEGDEKNLKKFLEWCYRGPRWSQVDRVEYGYTKKMRKYIEFKVL